MKEPSLFEMISATGGTLIDDEYKYFSFEEEAEKQIKRAKQDLTGIPLRDLKLLEANTIVNQAQYLAVRTAYNSCSVTSPSLKFSLTNEKSRMIDEVDEIVRRLLTLDKVDNIICGCTAVSYLMLSHFFKPEKDVSYGIYQVGFLQDENKHIKIYKAPNIVLPTESFILCNDGVFLKGIIEKQATEEKPQSIEEITFQD